MITIDSIRHAYPEPNGLCIDRKNGLKVYTFLHFYESVEILLNGDLTVTRPNSVILYDIDTPQFFKIDGSLVHDWMHFSGDISPLCKLSGIQPDTLYYPQSFEFITQITKELENEFGSNFENKQEFIQLKFYELFLKLGRAVARVDGAVPNTETREKFRFLRGKMFSCIGEKWSVERMAAEVGFSPSRFYFLYKSIYGISPANDLICARINQAKTYLSVSNRRIEEISNLLGYENTTHFIRQFKEKTGQTPLSYRKQYR